MSCFPSRDVCRTNPGHSRFPTATLRVGTGGSTQPCLPLSSSKFSSRPLSSCSALCRLVSPTPMASADFCQPIPAPLDIGSTGQVDRLPKVMHVTFIPYTRRIYCHIFPDDYWALKIMPSRPDVTASYAIPVRRAGVLPAASFRFCLTTDTLAVRLSVPTTRVRGGLDFN